jgi:hypothetical protein
MCKRVQGGSRVQAVQQLTHHCRFAYHLKLENPPTVFVVVLFSKAGPVLAKEAEQRLKVSKNGVLAPHQSVFSVAR